ncbi:uncharacterized protein LOC121383849 [Gigantopelta aegis]|uniref:uncharacterized protein LOC121383849 n=1 Tax=Gigantopelta aegis TaxID=1735272 RepID=UPI001B889943|nr:uncharacterized protein LOC121383849 [Gigantopelta aegis]
MVMLKEEAYDVLELPVGADQDSIRTSYKRLALKWHPEKHSSSPESVKKFQQVSRAYKCLASDSSNPKDMTLPEMLRLFQEVFFSCTLGTLNGSGYNTSDDDDYDDSDDDDGLLYRAFGDKIKMKQELKKKQAINTTSRHLTSEEISRNAEELITEEEKEKKRAEKRRAKKKRRRERKKIEKQENPKEENEKTVLKGKSSETEKGKKSDKKLPSGTSSEGEMSFDPTSAFFTKVVNKKKKTPTQESSQTSKKDRSREKAQHGGKSEEEVEDLDPCVLRSRQLAIRGNEMAQTGHYLPAIELFTEAIKLDPRDFRFFGNRSYCFDRILQYEKALRDAEKAILLAKDWAKGYFRKGRALAGLKQFSEAEKSFMQVLKLDKNCEDAVQELLRVRTHQLTEMGFSRHQAESAIKKYGSVQAALDSLLAGVVADNSLSSEVYMSDEDEFLTTPTPVIPQPTPLQQSPPDGKMDPQNPEGLTALWVGNVLPQVTEKKLTQMFQKYGQVTSVRLLPEKYCAFINFKFPVSAGKAMQQLQGVECEGQRLLIKFPDNPICNGNVMIRKTSQQSQPLHSQHQLLQQQQQQQQPQQSSKTSGARTQQKQSGPVNGDECYFWRTTGCIYGDKCHFKHEPQHKGVDKKPWQKSDTLDSLE